MIAPSRFTDAAALAEEIGRARNLLVNWLQGVDEETLSAELLDVARTELDVDYA